jgi:hypothetical protein
MTNGAKKMIDIRMLIIAVGSAFVLGAGSSWWLTSDYKEAKYQAVLATMRADATAAIDAARQAALVIERRNNQLSTDLEVANNEFRANLDTVKDDNRRLVTELGGLYDRHSAAANCNVSTTTPASVGSAIAPAGSKLSKQLESLLLSESARADSAAAYAKTCFEWVKALK